MRLTSTMSLVAVAGLAGALLMPLPAAAGATAPSAGMAVASQAPADPPQSAIRVRWDWRMPPSMVDKTHIDPQTYQPVKGPDGIPDDPLKTVPGYAPAGNARYGPLPANNRFSVKLDASRSRGAGALRCSWRIDVQPMIKRLNRPCDKLVGVKLPEGKHALKLTVKDRRNSKTVRSKITVKNVLMGIMGDSYASGEGFPPFRMQVAGKWQIDWDYAPCQRSRWSGFVRAALQAEESDKRSNVTLLDVACAGAQIEYAEEIGVSASGGLLSPQQTSTQPAAYQPAQVDQLRAITGQHKLDVSLLSIGGNDAGLSPIAKTCYVDDVILKKGNCYMLSPLGTKGGPFYEIVNGSLDVLDDRYARLAPCVGASGGDQQCMTTKLENGAPAGTLTNSKPVRLKGIRRLFQAMYPDLTHQSDGNGAITVCDTGPPVESPLNQIDNTWAYGTLYTGRPGKQVALPTNYPEYQKPNPNPVVAEAKGLVPLLRQNRALYGWRIGWSLFERSHPHGPCADNPWIYGFTAGQMQGAPNLSGILHPNDEGQAAYAQMLGPETIAIAGLPVSRP